MKEYKYRVQTVTKKNREEYQMALQKEHADLLAKYVTLQEYLHKDNGDDKDSREEYILKRLQVATMEQYLNILVERMRCVGVLFDGCKQKYFIESGKFDIVDITEEDEQNTSDND